MDLKLPIGLQSFEKIIQGNFLYIDKTVAIHRLVTEGTYYFLSRPRRFGKSLTISTIKALFSGQKELFDGLWIQDNWDWTQQHPVIHISFSSIGYKELGLEKAISIALKEAAEAYSIELEKISVSQQFEELLKKLGKEKQVVLLIDEYDKPIIDYFDDIPQARAHQKILKSFYSVIKDADDYLRFMLVTGVSKFSKVSIFSELNNLDDITIDWRFADLVGITQEELEANFENRLDLSKQRLKMDRPTLLHYIKKWYNGYSWDGETFVYNPFSILNFFNKNAFNNFWFATGTPTFLIKILKNRMVYDIGQIEVGQVAFDSSDFEFIDTTSLLFQTGYLTIKSASTFGLYVLDYPNQEVKDSLLQYLIGAYSYGSKSNSTPLVLKLQNAFLKNDLETVMTIINGLFKSIPSHIFIKEKEAYYHSIIFLVFQYLGQFIEAEVNTSDGRIDAVVQTNTHIYILEFKLDESVKAALDQIRNKGYAEKYLSANKTVLGIGINFSSQTKSVEQWKTLTF